MILAGDVGGTKTALALFEEEDASLVPVREAELPSHEFATFEAAVHRFLGVGTPTAISAACFGVAGPVVDGRSVTTNLPWHLEETRLQEVIPAPRVRLLNDLEATGHGVIALPAAALWTLQPGVERRGHVGLIAAGTGLGEAIIVWDGDRHAVIASEGGHCDFAPRSEMEINLLRFLTREFGHVSYERVVSGPGLVNIYRFLRDTGHGSEPAWLAERLQASDPGAVISEVALSGGHPLCVAALDMFVSIYGAEAGNLALKALAVGGVFVAGGIAPKVRARLAAGGFVAAFRDKGRFADLLTSIPLQLVLEPRAALLGAARVAHALAGTAGTPSVQRDT